MKDRNNKIDCVDWSIASTRKSVAPWRGTSRQEYERKGKKNRKEARRGVPKVTHRNVSKDSESKTPGGSAVRSLLKRSLQGTSEWKFSTIEDKPSAAWRKEGQNKGNRQVVRWCHVNVQAGSIIFFSHTGPFELTADQAQSESHKAWHDNRTQRRKKKATTTRRRRRKDLCFF